MLDIVLSNNPGIIVCFLRFFRISSFFSFMALVTLYVFCIILWRDSVRYCFSYSFHCFRWSEYIWFSTVCSIIPPSYLLICFLSSWPLSTSIGYLRYLLSMGRLKVA
jgi:hypothetical protein